MTEKNVIVPVYFDGFSAAEMLNDLIYVCTGKKSMQDTLYLSSSKPSMHRDFFVVEKLFYAQPTTKSRATYAVH